jgi:molybdopterin-guanine dinucleotide biosynthesis protein A
VDAAVILAGGASSRMGRDKAWLDLDGRPLLVHVVSIVAERCRPIVIAARPGQELPRIDHSSVERVDDEIADGGPLVGLVGALARLAERGVERAYIGSCDAAAITTAHVAFMLDALRGDPTKVAMVPCDHDGLAHPLASAVVVDAMLARAKSQLSRQELRLQELFQYPQVGRVAAARLPDEGVLAPCNTPEQWRALTLRLGSR